MKLELTPENLAACYEYLRSTRPFRGWKLPPASEVTFKVAKTKKTVGWYTFDGYRHYIYVSSSCVGTSHTLVEVMAHEMVHLDEKEKGTCRTDVEHSAHFNRKADLVCKHHGFDRKMF